MKYFLLGKSRLLKATLLLLLTAGAAWCPAEPAVPDNAALDDDAIAPGTVITSRRLNYDQNARQAVFEGNVLVADPQLRIKADKLTVIFSEANEVRHLCAEGRVAISQRELTAGAGRADYDVAEGRVVLTVNPAVRRGRDMLTGETITFWRDSSRILCEPNARLILHSEREALTGITMRE